MDCGPPGSSVHGILQARILEWALMSSSRGSAQHMDQTQVSHIAGRFFTMWVTREAPTLLKTTSRTSLSPMGFWSTASSTSLKHGHHRSSGSSSCIPFPELFLFSFTWSVIHFCISITSWYPLLKFCLQTYFSSYDLPQWGHWHTISYSLVHLTPSFIQHVLIDWLLGRRHSARTWWSKKSVRHRPHPQVTQGPSGKIMEQRRVIKSSRKCTEIAMHSSDIIKEMGRDCRPRQ